MCTNSQPAKVLASLYLLTRGALPRRFALVFRSCVSNDIAN